MTEETTVNMSDYERMRRFQKMARNITRALAPRAFTLADDIGAERYGGRAICEHCGLEWLEHPQLSPSLLYVTCDGKLIKL